MFTEDSVVLIDADSIYFRAACVTEKQNELRKSINHTINQIKQECLTDKMLIAVKGEGNFRHDIYPQYKANRKELPDNVRRALNYGHSYMCDYHGAIRADGMEADDLVSIWAYEAMDMDQDYTIAGLDKDLLQIPGAHYNFKKSTHTYVDYDTANMHLMLQCLTGDSTDNIPGIKGIGPKKAEKILFGQPTKRRWTRVQAAWRAHKAGDPKLSRRLLEMLTSWKEYDQIRNEIERKANVSEPNVREEGQDDVQD